MHAYEIGGEYSANGGVFSFRCVAVAETAAEALSELQELKDRNGEPIVFHVTSVTCLGETVCQLSKRVQWEHCS